MSDENKYTIKITDVDIPFLRLVAILVKVALALIPASLILAVFWAILTGVLIGLNR